MIRGLYASATGIDALMLQQQFAAENLAHVNVPGYRRQGIAYQTFEQALQSLPDVAAGEADQVDSQRSPFTPGQDAGGNPPTASGNATDSLVGTRVAYTYTDFVPGALERTGNPLDLAATGDAFFVVNGPNGPLLTRNGALQLNQAGELQTTSGLNLRGEGGAITIPPDTRQIVINEEGTVFADGAQIGRILVVNVPQAAGLDRAGTTLFQGPIPTTGAPPGTVRVLQGYREQSNVQPVLELINLLAAARTIEANDRALRSLAESLALATRPQ
ncbi:MAG: flagellar hook-basal body protein [Gemmataceae bacterium]|nr:flagellar hook-basal body protein [Gemmataceae bacterium]